MVESIRDDITPDDDHPFPQLMNEDATIELAELLHDNGVSRREAEALATDFLDRDTHAEQQHLRDLSRILDLDPSTIRSHFNNAKQTVDEATAVRYMFRETLPQRIIGQFAFGSHTDHTDKVIVTVGRQFTYDSDQPDPDDATYIIYFAEYENTGWREHEYRGENVERVTGRRKVLDTINHHLTEYKSNDNPVRIIGELMYALDLDDGMLDPDNEYDVRMELVNPLCDATSPPDDHDKPPIVFAKYSSVLKRFDDTDE